MSAPIEVFPAIEQGSEEWLRARAGIATASNFATLLVKPKDKTARWSQTMLTYAYEVAGEIITGEPAPAPDSFDMRRGRAWEPEARADYEFIRGAAVEQVGFVRRGRAGASPDGLVGSDGMVEIKTHKPAILIPMKLDPEKAISMHRAQIQGNLWAADREWIDLFGYWPKMDPFLKRVYRDEPFIAQLEQAIAEFSDAVDDIVDRLLRGETDSLPIAAE